VETCKLNGVEPHAYFTDVLTKIVQGWPAGTHPAKDAVDHAAMA